ncbi:MAG: hypothetical protein M0R70_04735 [Nitrospirae bacterium]|nr:hypothetical protein [Nitrospirota bacterium]
MSDTPEAKEAGFRFPVCITVGVHALVQVPELLSGWQDYGGRLWDTLFLAAAAFKLAGEKHLVPFDVVYQTALAVPLRSRSGSASRSMRASRSSCQRNIN